jgi:plastocyanin
MRGKLAVLAPLAVALVLVATACGGGGKKESSEEGGTTTISGQASNDHGTKDVSGMSSVDLELDNFYFEPTVLKGTPGQKLTIELENEGNVEHNFSISDQSIDQDVEAGEKKEVDVTFPQSGTLSFFCKYHRSQGMAGGLTVGGSSSGGSGTDTGSSGTSTGY